MLPIDEKKLAALVDSLPRTYDDYYGSNIMLANAQGNFPGKFDGNLAKLIITGNPKLDGFDWIAGSKRAAPYARQPIDDGKGTGLYIWKNPKTGRLFFKGKETYTEFDPEFDVGNLKNPRPKDSEYLLFNALNFALDVEGIDEGEVYLLTERIPCISCTSVINQFLKKFKKIKLYLFYMYDSKDWSHTDFFQNCSMLNQISTYHVHLTNDGGKAVVNYWQVFSGQALVNNGTSTAKTISLPAATASNFIDISMIFKMLRP